MMKRFLRIIIGYYSHSINMNLLLLLPGTIYGDQVLKKVTESTPLHKDLSNVVSAYLLPQNVIVSSTNTAFAVVSARGQLITWGSAGYGGDSSSVQAELKDQVVQHIYSTWRAFAAVLASGRVVTWGHPDWGGDSSSVIKNGYFIGI